MGFSSIADITTALDNGQFWSQHYIKPGVVGQSLGITSDLSGNSGIPVLSPYAATPLAFTPQSHDRNKFVFTGPTPPAGQSKYIMTWEMRHSSTQARVTYTLCDLLGFYAAIDSDSVDLQTMDNTLTLPRYTSGEGVQMVIQNSVATSASNIATIEYVNHLGQTKTITSTVLQRTATQVASCASSAFSGNATSLFLSLTGGDLGVRQVNSIQFDTAVGGLMNLLLVKPIARTVSNENLVSTEKNFITQQGIAMPKLEDGAALIIYAHGAIASAIAPIHGYFNFVWG